MIQWLLRFLFQTVFQAEGLSLEKLVSLCACEAIRLCRIKRLGPKRLVGRVGRRDYPRLCQLAQERGWQVTSLGAAGLGRWVEELKKRWGLAVGLALLMILAGAAMQFIWQVEIDGAGAYAGDIRAYLSQQAIGVGTLRRKVDLKALQSELEWRYPKVAWVQAALRGSTLIIRLVEGVPVPQVAPYGAPGDVVAARGGIVVSVEPAAGTAQVKAGDIVTTGQVLIKGEEKRGGEETVLVKARGRILARVWDQARVWIPMTETLSRPTGQSQVMQAVVTPFFTWGSLARPNYLTSDTLVEIWPLGGAWWPVTLRRETTQETALEISPRPEEQVKAEAGLAALRALRQKIGLNDELVDKWVDYCMIEGGRLEACATAERVVDIAQPAPYGQEKPSF